MSSSGESYYCYSCRGHLPANRLNSHHQSTKIIGTKIFKSFLASFFSYSTVRLARIYNVKLALSFRIMQLSIAAYVIFYQLFHLKMYQSIDDQPLSSLRTKWKGVGFAYPTTDPLHRSLYQPNGRFILNNNDSTRIFDACATFSSPIFCFRHGLF